MTRLFLDTEWADPDGEHLVSLALVTEDGAQHFYAEVDPLPEQPTLFVRGVVYPLLERGEAALPAREFTGRLRAFLLGLPPPHVVIFDYNHDGVLLRRVLTGYGQPWADELGPEPQISYCLLPQGDLANRLEDYFELHASAAKRRHHAGVDAEALRRAFRAAVFGDPIAF